MQFWRLGTPAGLATWRFDLALLRLVWPQLAAAVLLLALGASGSWLLSAARAYVAGESYWSKAQKDAVVHLLRYSRMGDPEDYARFSQAIGVTLGDRQARLELDKPDFDRELAEQGFLQGRNDAADIPGMIALYRWFAWYPKLARAVELWAEGDRHIDSLLAVAQAVHSQGGSIALDQRILAVHADLAPIEDAFSVTVSAAAREFALVILLLQSAVAVGLMGLAAQVSRRIVLRAQRAEGALQSVSDRLEVVLEGSNDGHWDWDLREGTMHLSARFKQQLGYPVEFPLEPSVLALAPVHPDDAARVLAAVQRLKEGRASLFDIDMRMRGRNGEFRWFHARGKAMFGPGGAAVRISGAMTDIHERVLAQDALADSEALNRGLLEASHDAVLVVDTHGTIRFANSAVRTLFGWEPEEVRDQPITLLQPPRLHPLHHQGFERVIETTLQQQHAASRLPITGRHRNGEEFPLELSFHEIHVEGERLFAAFLRDVTAWTQSRQALKQSMALLHATQAVAQVGGWEVDVAGGNPVHWTPQMYEMLELSPDTFAPTVENTLQFFPPEERQRVQEIIADAIERQQAHDAEFQMVTASGRRIWVHSRGHLTIQDGRTVKRTSTVRDITVQKLAQLEQANATRLQEQTRRQLDLALEGAQVALWGYEPPTGRVTHALRWEIFGHSEMPATFAEWQTLVHPEDLAHRLELLDRYLSGHSEMYEAEYRLRAGDGNWVWVRSRGQVVSRGPHGEPLLYAGVVMDISSQVAARQVVNDQRQFFEAMVEGVDTGVLISSDAHVVYANASFRRALALPAADIAEVFEVQRLFSRPDWEREQRRRQSLSAGIAVPSAIYNLRALTGEPAQAALNLSRVVWNGQPHYITTMTPLTEHAMLQLQLEATHRRFERVLISELEAQQAHIARELHDSLGSELAALSLMLGGVKAAVTNTRIGQYVDQALAQVASSAEVTRALARGLMPVDGHPGAFWRAVERLASDLTKVKGVACEFSMDGNLDNVAPDVGSHLYRIAQEAVANAIRHGRAGRVAIHLERKGPHCAMSVLDDGIGFDIARLASDRPGLGLRSMQARAKALGGQLRFLRGPTGGCEVRVTWSTVAPQMTVT